MPKQYGARCGENQHQRPCPHGRGLSPRSVIFDVCRIELALSGGTRRETLLEKKVKSVLQGASAMGSFAVSSAPERPHRLFDFGVSVSARMAHVNRAYDRSSLE